MLCLAAVLFTVSCNKEEKKGTPSLSGYVLLHAEEPSVEDIDSYGMLVPSFTPKDLMDAGFQYADYLDVRIGDKIYLHNVPFTTGFNEVGVMETCFCDYNGLGQMYGFGLLHGNFSQRIGGTIGDRIDITLSEKQGYRKTYDIMHSVYGYDPDAYPSKEVFANFRKVTTTGMADGVLYRSSNPLNPKDNAVRYAYVDTLARNVGIKTEIDLADTEMKIRTFMEMEGYLSTYCPALFTNKHTIALGLTADTYSSTFMEKFGAGLKFMIENEPPYLVHCNEGKDRCGFAILVLEALAGATYEEVAADYMQTLINFYKIEKGDESYVLRQTLSIDRLVWLPENVDAVDDFTNIDWTKADPKKVDLHSAARNYVLGCGLTETECNTLESILTGSK